jgi:hypothetical protein
MIDTKQKVFEEMLRQEDGRETDYKIHMEIKDVSKLMLSLSTL